MIEKKCLWCGKTIYTTLYKIEHGLGKYCGQKCYWKSKKGKRAHNYSRVTLVCKNCKKEFTAPRGRKNKKYCSNSCRLAARRGVSVKQDKSWLTPEKKKQISETLKRGYATGKIKHTKTEFKKGHPSPNKGKRGRTYKSMYGAERARQVKEKQKKRALERKKEPIVKKCSFCGEEFYTKQWRINIGKGKYCSKECYWKSKKGQISPKYSKKTVSCKICGEQFLCSPKRATVAKYCSRKCSNLSKIGKANKNKGKTGIYSEEVTRKISNTLKEGYATGRIKNVRKGKKLPYPVWNKNLTKADHPSIALNAERCSKTKKEKGIGKGSSNPAWLGGKSFEPYGLAFNNDLKKIVLERDNYTCQLCKKSKSELKIIPKRAIFNIHHIDYDKRNNTPKNLVTLCVKCHIHTNTKRKYWINYFNELMNV